MLEQGHLGAVAVADAVQRAGAVAVERGAGHIGPEKLFAYLCAPDKGVAVGHRCALVESRVVRHRARRHRRRYRDRLRGC